MPREQELEYFHKDRIHHLETEIEPALSAGRVVICDRYVDSTLAFQARTPAEADKFYKRMVKEIIVPHVTLILDCPVEIGLSRIQRSRARFSAFEDRPTLEKARKIYATRKGPHYLHIDASKDIENTFNQVCVKLRRRIPLLRAYLTACEFSEGDHSLKLAIA
jgi:dTMP kinase